MIGLKELNLRGCGYDKVKLHFLSLTSELALMQNLRNMMMYSWLIVGQNYVLLYPVLFFQLALGIIFAQASQTTFDLDLKWALLILVVMLLYNAINAGWYAMLLDAVQHFSRINILVTDAPKETETTLSTQTGSAQTPNTEPPAVDSFFEPFKRFNAFLPGVGEHFWSFVLGNGIQILVGLFLLAISYLIIEQTTGFPSETIAKDLMSQAEKLATTQEMKKYLLNLPTPEQDKIAFALLCLMGSLLVYMIFSTLTFLWPAFVVSHHVGAFKAYWLSLRQFFKDPGRILLMAMFLIVSYMTMGQLGQTDNGILAIFVQFFIFFIQTLFSVLLIVYVLQASPLPSTLDEQNEPELKSKS